MEPVKPPTRQRLVYLDAIRGIAALLVVYTHFSAPARNYEHVSELVDGYLYGFLSYVDLGKVGVVAFFAVSGFVIPFSLLRQRDKPLRSFLIGRFFRLYPVYWLSIPLGVYFVWHLEGKAIDFKTIALNFTMLQQFFLQKNVLGLYWTLQMELTFYLLCAGLFHFGKLNDQRTLYRISLGCLGLAFFCSLIRFFGFMKMPVAYPLALSVMFWGAIWRDYVIDENLEGFRLGRRFIGLFAALIPLISYLAYSASVRSNQNWYRYAISYYIAIGVILVFTKQIRLTSPVFAWLGKISYSVYLFHGIINKIIQRFVDYDYLVSHRIPSHLVILVGALISVGFAHVTYHLVEAPMIQLGKRIIKRGQPTSAPNTQLVATTPITTPAQELVQ